MNLTKAIAGVALAAALGAMASSAGAAIVVPDPSPNPFIAFGGPGSSTVIDGVTFSTSPTLGNGNFYNVGPLFSGDPAVLSDQQETVGLANILISLPAAVTSFALDYGTFNGSPVTFLLSNGDSFTQASTGSGYLTPNVFTANSTPFNSVLVTSGDYVLDINNIGVPEPATWAMMLLGVGFIGGGLRLARRQVGAAVAAL
ncbi:MAG TPA: PEPxxWA-CTERM sorting domain-containing protein [Caulobacteraceae bacterium]|nr:PEPxxWA-CTERM sorting domain-containing protein [Caulobacteraceae bacterium]